MKNLEWLKEEVDYIKSVVSMIGRGNTVADGITAIENIIKELNQVEQPELPEVPTWFAEWCEKRTWGDKIQQGNHYTRKDLNELIEIADFENLHGLTKKQAGHIADDFFKYLNALQNGYTVEEKKYYVLNNIGRLLLRKYSDGVSEISVGTMNVDSEWFESEKYELTEQEIKDFDERYFAFAKEINE